MSWLSWLPHRGQLPELPPPNGLTPVVFLHGLLGSPGNFEAPITALLQRGAPIVAPAYGNHGTARIDDCLDELRPHLARLDARAIDVVGHSYGALLGLRLAEEFPVRTLVGVGPAWRGVAYSRSEALRRTIGVVAGPGAKELLRRAPLDARVPARTRVVSIVSGGDRIIPRASADLGEVVELAEPVRHEHLPAQTEAILSALRWRG